MHRCRPLVALVTRSSQKDSRAVAVGPIVVQINDCDEMRGLRARTDDSLCSKDTHDSVITPRFTQQQFTHASKRYVRGRSTSHARMLWASNCNWMCPSKNGSDPTAIRIVDHIEQ